MDLKDICWYHGNNVLEIEIKCFEFNYIYSRFLNNNVYILEFTCL